MTHYSAINFIGENFHSYVPSIDMYSDGTTRIKLDNLNEIAVRADTLLVKSSYMSTFMAAMSLVDGLDSVADTDVIRRLILPYIPGARQDRANPTGDMGYMLQTVARIINAYGFEQVLVADPHSAKAGELINNMVEYPMERVYNSLWAGYTGVVAPDKGAEARALMAAQALSLPCYYGSKVRDVATGRLSGFEVKVEEGGHYLVVDDICDGGGTFIGLGEKIREQGAYADLFVTHGIFSKGYKDLKKIYKNIYTTNSYQRYDDSDLLLIDILTGMSEYR